MNNKYYKERDEIFVQHRVRLSKKTLSKFFFFFWWFCLLKLCLSLSLSFLCFLLRKYFLVVGKGGCLCHLFSFFLSLHLPAPRAQTSKKYIHNKRVTISQFCCSRDDFFFFFFDFIDFFDFSLVLREKKDVFFVEKKRHRRPTM